MNGLYYLNMDDSNVINNFSNKHPEDILNPKHYWSVKLGHAWDTAISKLKEDGHIDPLREKPI